MAGRPGLFGILGLRAPRDFIALMAEAKMKSDSILHRITVSAPDASIVQLVDDLSDEVMISRSASRGAHHAAHACMQIMTTPHALQLCQTYDAAECCRNIHPDPSWQQAAGKVCEGLGGGYRVVTIELIEG